MSEVLSDAEIEEARRGFVGVWDFIGRQGPRVFTTIARLREEVARLQGLIDLPCSKKHDEKIAELEKVARETEVTRDEYKNKWMESMRGLGVAVERLRATEEKLDAARRAIEELEQGSYRGNSVSYIHDKMMCYRDQVGTLGEVTRILGFKPGEGYDGNAEMRRAALEWAERTREKLDRLSAGRLPSGAPSYLHCDHSRPWWECPSHDRGFIAIFHAQRDRDTRRGDR